MRLYTEAEARAILPSIIPVIEKLRDCFVELRALQATIAAEARGATGDGNLLADPWADEGGDNRVEGLSRDLRSAAGQLSELGIEVKDPEKGLIDFYHHRDGRVVYLCYMLGESGIGFWHELRAGFAGRQPL
jgi:hypothetical protein